MIIAIDPGASGAIVWRGSNSHLESHNMPDTLRGILDLLNEAKAQAIMNPKDPEEPVIAYMEKVGTYMPGNSGPSAATFAEHVGALKMALIATCIKHELITPATWEHAYIGKQVYDTLPKDLPAQDRRRILAERKRERKRLIKAKGERLFPEIKVTLSNADALGMLWYGEREQAQYHLRGLLDHPLYDPKPASADN